MAFRANGFLFTGLQFLFNQSPFNTLFMKEKKSLRQRCHNCKFRGDLFKIGTLAHCHCEHPDLKENLNPWDSLREFWSKCEKHEYKRPF
jgi:hypothetical protein